MTTLQLISILGSVVAVALSLFALLVASGTAQLLKRNAQQLDEHARFARDAEAGARSQLRTLAVVMALLPRAEWPATVACPFCECPMPATHAKGCPIGLAMLDAAQQEHS